MLIIFFKTRTSIYLLFQLDVPQYNILIADWNAFSGCNRTFDSKRS